MKKLFTFLLSACVCTLVMAQRPEAVIAKAGATKPTIDGTIDALWATVEQHNVVLPFGAEAPTLGDEGTTYWKALYDENGIYVIVVVNDDVFIPHYAGDGTLEYQYDKIELYFDTNAELADGIGASGKAGNWQVAPKPTDGIIDGTMIEEAVNGMATKINYAYNVTDPTWNVEYFVPWATIPDATGTNMELGAPMGFDVTIVDRDDLAGTRNRAVWSNVGGVGESWGNMDDIGYVTFEGAVNIPLDKLTLTSGGDITSDNGTSKATVALLPANATQSYIWNMGGTAKATVSKDGLITASKNGTLTLQAVSTDGTVKSNTITLNISNQLITLDEISILKNGYFDKGDNGLEGWGTATIAAAGPAVVEDGVFKMTMVPSTNRWDININQGFPVIDAATKYLLRFKASASTDMVIDLIMEDTANAYAKNGVSTSPYGAASDWQIPLTTEATWFELDVTFAALLENSKYSVGWQGGKLEGEFYLDSVTFVNEADLALISTSINSSLANVLSVYPNPVKDQLTVTLASATKGKVAIFNSLGQKLMEKAATSNTVRFDVSSLRKGIYFVKFNDGPSQKFVK